jgi:methylthioribose-1-phosphate isomerase
VDIDENGENLVIIDQTLLPQQLKILKLNKRQDIFTAIQTLQVRGAPAIGVAAAIGVYLAVKDFDKDDYADFCKAFTTEKEYLASSRPTAVNLFWALSRMENIVKQNSGRPVQEIKSLLLAECRRIRDEDVASCYAIGVNGLPLLLSATDNGKKGILTHCNAGRLATVRYGTALSPIYVGLEQNVRFKVYADETRPLLQGARLTAYELSAAGVDVTVQCDNMASSLMQKGLIGAVITGADRITANGDVCNKIGTSALAILAKYYGIPFYAAAPFSTIDSTLKTGSEIPIEQRSKEEVSEMWYKLPMTPENVNVYNPAFDVTDHSLVTAVITDKGVYYPEYRF